MKYFIYFCIFLNITSTFAERDRPSKINASSKLINEPVCADLRNFCAHLTSDNDLDTLECIQTFQASQMEDVSEDCQHLIWTHTRDILNDASVVQYTQKDCEKQNDKLQDCKTTGQVGNYLSCLIGKLDNIKVNGACRTKIQRLESVAFSDYRLLGNFMQDCGNDVDNLSCGRLNADRDKVSQGETIACLQEKIDALRPICKKRILRISQQQSENIKLDHQFFLGCETDLIRLCPNERPGTGGVYKCLVKHKSNPDLTAKCREQIVRRDKLLARDYKVSKGLARGCRDDIRNHHCRRGVSDDKNVRLAQILLCLETVAKNGTKLSNECNAEMIDHRKMLMMDYHLSPEILTGCSDDIQKFCGDSDIPNKAGDEIIHCLMENVRPKRRKDRRVTAVCQRAIEQLIKVTDVGEDWRVDPILRRACKAVVDYACRDTEGGDARVMSCLMEHIGTEVMTKDCESALLLIQYFIARDFKLDPQLYRNCRDDAVKYCKAKKSWDDSNTNQMDPERGPLILPCLHRIAYSTDKKIDLKKECFQEIKRVMRQRAVSVDLIPEVEDQCLEDLATYCFDKTEKGAEMLCLQDNIEKLQRKCKEAVSSYTEDEAAHVELNPLIMSVCHDAMENHCSHILKRKDQGDMMDCLILHKNDPDMRQDLKCRAAVEHFQIISLKNYHFTYKFKEACRPYVSKYCSSSTTKYDVVACLSEVTRNDTIRGLRHSIQKECRQQVKAQLYQQRENIDFDPKLKSSCKKDIAQYCFKVPNGPGEILECLKVNSNHLSDSCRHALFTIKKSELDDSSTDYTLVNSCKDMTNKYCQDIEQSKLLDCLKLYKDKPLFNPVCHLVVVNRMIEQNTDFRFNPALQNACGKNIARYCSNIVATAKPNEELNGKVINCLKIKFREAKLDHDCEEKMTEILQEQALNYKLNPLLQSLCKSEIKVLCPVSSDRIEEHGEVEECLKTAFSDGKLLSKECKTEVATIIQEAKADIHVDPLLQRACAVDLLKYCLNVKSGNGRQLKCLQVILQDESKAMEEDCKKKLEQRIEMFKNAEQILSPANMEQLFSQVVTSPSKKYFLVILMTFIGIIFIIGMFCGRVTKRAITLKNK